MSAGERAQRMPKHVFALPKDPLSCCVLALGLHFATGTFPMGDSKIFAGCKIRLIRFCVAVKFLSVARQSTFFGERLRKALTELEDNGRLSRYGRTRADFGVHSFRKGSSSYSTSGVVDGPSIVSVCQRAAWTMGNVLVGTSNLSTVRV